MHLEYFRNDVLDARNFFAADVDPHRQNEFGVVVGGPIVKDKLFFFASYTGFRLRTAPAGVIQTVPTPKMRNGDFSEHLGAEIGTDMLGRPIFQGQICDPMTTRPDGQGGFIRDTMESEGLQRAYRTSAPDRTPIRKPQKNQWIAAVRECTFERWTSQTKHQEIVAALRPESRRCLFAGSAIATRTAHACRPLQPPTRKPSTMERIGWSNAAFWVRRQTHFRKIAIHALSVHSCSVATQTPVPRAP